MLKLEHISKRFGNLQVLRDLSLTVGKNEIVALIGPSGCGKTTLLNCISGLETPDSGFIDRQDIKISYMFQESRLLPWRTVWQNIALVRDDGQDKEIRELIDAVGLRGFGHYYPGQLSGGMIRRCALARAFHYGGDLLMMDEPFQGLDYGIRMEMLDMLLDIWKKRQSSILFITHEIDEALTIASRILVLTSRPTTVREIILPPGREGRDASDPALAGLRQQIIHFISKEVNH